jgi:hypothetical protein
MLYLHSISSRRLKEFGNESDEPLDVGLLELMDKIEAVKRG